MGLSALTVALPGSNLLLAASRKSYCEMTMGRMSMPASMAMWKAPFLNGIMERSRARLRVPSGKIQIEVELALAHLRERRS